ncbi:MAG: hypothetical protein HYR60_15180, partial [Acidobacteria bacterium]|nr:hypothetical protein [Acidobacteriota bacterium]
MRRGIVFFLPLLALAQSGEVVEGVIKRVKENYVFPEVAQKMERRLRERLQNKE